MWFSEITNVLQASIFTDAVFIYKYKCPAQGVEGAAMDQDKMDVALIAMRTKLNLRLDVCVQAGCTTTDMFMVAALSADEQIAPSTLRTAFKNPDYKSADPQTTLVDWEAFLNGRNWPKQSDRDHNIDLIHKFQSEVLKLQEENYFVPNVAWKYVTGLK